MFNEPAPNTENADEDLHQASDVEKADVDLGAQMASQRDHPIVKAAGDAGEIGDQGPLYGLSAGLLLVGLASGNRRLAGSGVSMCAGVAAADISKRLTKRLVRRTRPHVQLDEGRYKTDAGGSDHKPDQSFPSGHMACSTAAARALSRNFLPAGAAAGVTATAVGISRVAKGAHWPLDVIAGAVIGLAAEAVSARFLKFGAVFIARVSGTRRGIASFSLSRRS
jgi:membrane-associated phospholipid phosphatase